jgi:hypothetical protein
VDAHNFSVQKVKDDLVALEILEYRSSIVDSLKYKNALILVSNSVAELKRKLWMQFSIELYKVIISLPQRPWYFCSKEMPMRELLFKQLLICSAADNQGIQSPML